MPDDLIHLLGDDGGSCCPIDGGLLSSRLEEVSCPHCLRAEIAALENELSTARQAPPSLGDPLVAAATMLQPIGRAGARKVVELAFELDAIVRGESP